jgi:hypothetical protein
MQRLLYVSESRIDETESRSVVSQIVAHAQVKNAQLGLTGALIFTGDHFAQVLEGSPDAIQIVMAYIHNDPRHANVVIADMTPINSRAFPDWQMAYQGPSQFVSRHVARLLHVTSKSERERLAEWITDLAREFTATV